MIPLSEQMRKVAKERRIRTPAIWTVLGDYADKVKEYENALSMCAGSMYDRVEMQCIAEDALKENK